MKISTRGRYGLRALVDMAANASGGPASLLMTAQRQNISLNYLEQVFAVLRKAGIVTSVKGAGGGYRLAREMDCITVKEVLEALEGEFSIIGDAKEESGDPVQGAIRTLVWEELDEKIGQFLERRTLGQLVKEYQKNLEADTVMYYI